MPLALLLSLSAFVFCVGLFVVFTRNNVLFILIGIELMLNSACFNFVLFSRYDPAQQGRLFVLLIMAMIVCETSVALAIIFKVYQQHQSINLVDLQSLKEE